MRRSAGVLLWAPVLLRLVLCLLLPDFEADAYTRMAMSETVAEALRGRGDLLAALYVPVWPPLWHLLCALVELVWPSVYYVPKVLSALCGGLVPYLVYRMTERVAPGAPGAPGLAWLLAALSPLPLLYGTSAMSESCYGLLFVGAAYCFLRAEPGNRWLLGAAAALTAAALIRFDGWILLLALVPLAWWQRRVRGGGAAAALLLLALGPLGWFALNLRMTGHPFGFLRTHGAYVQHFYATYRFHDLFHDRGPLGLLFQLSAIVCTMGVAITAFGVREAWRARGRDARGLGAFVLVAFGYLFLLWIVRRQVGWRRHYLAIGCALIPFAAPALLSLRRRLLLGVLLLDLAVLLPSSAALCYVPRRYAQAAAYLRDHAAAGRVYCDEPGVRLLSRFARGRFVSNLPKGEGVAWLRREGVRYLVYAEVDYSTLAEAFPGLREPRDQGPFRLVYVPSGNVYPLQRVYVYELSP